MQVLNAQLYGRIAGTVKGRLYVVPVSYVVEGDYIYAHSREGLKIEMLRQNHEVCFQVDVVDNLANWRSVLAWGRYEELTNSKAQSLARSLLDSRFDPLHVSESISRPSAGIHPPESVEKKKNAVFFRISLDELTGRFEKST